MRKLNKIALFVAILIITSVAAPALAATLTAEEANHLQNVNLHIYREIEKAQLKADEAMAIGDYASLDVIIESLLDKTASLVEAALDWAARQGILAEHNFIDVTIGDRTVTVDPIHILW